MKCKNLRGGEEPITSFRHSGDRGNSEYFSNRLCLWDGWIIYYLIKNLSWACDREGQRGGWSSTVTTLCTTWNASLGRASLGRGGSATGFQNVTSTALCAREPQGPLHHGQRNQAHEIGPSFTTTCTSHSGPGNEMGFGVRRHGFTPWVDHVAPSCVSLSKVLPLLPASKASSAR